MQGSWFVHELSEVRPGAGPEYLGRVMAERRPAMAERGIALVGAYEAVLNDTEVCTIWAADVASHTQLLRDRDPWPDTARTYCTRWREELMTPGRGTLLARPQETA